jgi:hypothetical protein
LLISAWLALLLMYANPSASHHLTSLALADLQLEAFPSSAPASLAFPHLTSLDIRRVAAFGKYLVDVHPVGQQTSTPQLRTLHISPPVTGA